MSFHQPPPSSMAPPPLHVGVQGNMMPSYMPPSSTLPPGLPPPPLPPPFPGFPVPPPGQPGRNLSFDKNKLEGERVLLICGETSKLEDCLTLKFNRELVLSSLG